MVNSLMRSLILAALVMLTACGESEEAPQFSDTTKADQPLVLEFEGGVLTIPANALKTDSTVGISVLDSAQFDPDASAPYEAPVTRGVTLHFPELAAARQPIILELQTTAPLQSGIYGKLRTVGPGPTEGINDTGWQHVIGVYDEQASTYRIAIGTTPKRISIIAVTAIQGQNPQGKHAPPVEKFLLDRMALLTNILGISEANAQSEGLHPVIGPVPLTDKPWAVICHPQVLPGCNSNSQALMKIADWAHLSARSLVNLGFADAYLSRLSRKQVSDAGFTLVPNRVNAAGQDFYVIEVRQDVTFIGPNGTAMSRPGFYQPATASLVVKADVKSTTVIHEIFHAVQRSDAFRTWNRLWLIEGTATAVIPFAPDLPPGVAQGRDFRLNGHWRSWGKHLAAYDTDSSVAYETAELWLSIDPSLQYLPGFLKGLESKVAYSTIKPENEFQHVDDVLQKTTGKGLRDHWQDLILNRDGSHYYPLEYCELRFTECEGFECELLDPDQDIPRIPMVGACRDFEIEATKAACADPSFDVSFDGTEEIHDFLVDGEWFEPGDETTVSAKPRVWLVNSYIKGTSGQRENPSKPPRMTLRPRCLAVTRLNMDVTVRASATSREQQRSGRSHSEYYSRSLDWEVGNEHLRDSEDWTRDGVKQQGMGGGAAHLDNVHFRKTVEASPGATAHAELRAVTRLGDRDFLVEGHARLEVEGGKSGQWDLNGNSSLSYSLVLSVQKPSEVEISNCFLFEQAPLEGKPGFRKEAESCFMLIEDPGGESPAPFAGMGADLQNIMAAEGLGFSDEEYEELMETLEDEDTLQFATRGKLKEAARLTDALYGTVLPFMINLDRFEYAYGEPDADSIDETFSIHIRELSEEELDE